MRWRLWARYLARCPSRKPHPARVSRRRVPLVAVVESADLRDSDDGANFGALDGLGLGWVLSQRKVRPGSVVVVYVATNRAQQLRFVERDDVVETFPT